jgi:diacylglycerol kinase (ATP)
VHYKTNFIPQCEKTKKTVYEPVSFFCSAKAGGIQRPWPARGLILLKSGHPAQALPPSEPRMTNQQQPTSEFKSKSGVKRILSAFSYSIDGLRAAWNNEHAFRQELALVAVATIAALWLPVSALEKLMLIGVFVLVLIVELINSAIEAIVDRVSLERHSLSKNAKDLGSAAVLLTLSLAVATWIVILLPLMKR